MCMYSNRYASITALYKILTGISTKNYIGHRWSGIGTAEIVYLRGIVPLFVSNLKSGNLLFLFLLNRKQINSMKKYTKKIAF